MLAFFITLVIVVLIILLLIASIKIVHSGDVKVLERFGNYVKTLQPGLHLVVPIIYAVRQTVSLRQRPLQMDPFDVITKENATIQVEVSLKYHVNDVESYVYKNENSEESVILDCQSSLRGIIGNMELNDVLNGTTKINASLFTEIKDVASSYGVSVDRINIGEITPSTEVQASMDKLITANRNKEAMITEAQGFKEKTIQEAQGQAQQVTINAQAQAEQVRIAAQAQADQINLLANADAKRISVVNQAVQDSALDDKML